VGLGGFRAFAYSIAGLRSGVRRRFDKSILLQPQFYVNIPFAIFFEKKGTPQ
jgi:hypothetical protein